MLGFGAQTDTQGQGIAIGVFNALGWPRTDIATTDVGFTDSGVTDLKLIGPDVPTYD